MESFPLFIGTAADLQSAIGSDLVRSSHSPFRQQLALRLSHRGLFNAEAFATARGGLNKDGEALPAGWIGEHLLPSWCPMREPSAYYEALLTAMVPPLNAVVRMRSSSNARATPDGV